MTVYACLITVNKDRVPFLVLAIMDVCCDCAYVCVCNACTVSKSIINITQHDSRFHSRVKKVIMSS